MNKKRIEKVIILYITPPCFDELREKDKNYFIDVMKKTMGEIIPYEVVGLTTSKDFYLRIKTPELWDFQVTYSNNGERVLKQIFYEGYE